MNMQSLSQQEMLEVNGGALLGGLLGGSNGNTNNFLGLDNLLGGFITIMSDDADGTGTHLAISIQLNKLFDYLNLNNFGSM